VAAIGTLEAACPESARLIAEVSNAAYGYAGGAHSAGVAFGARAEALRRAIVGDD